jgi:lipopolysaccharide assembly protein A
MTLPQGSENPTAVGQPSNGTAPEPAEAAEPLAGPPPAPAPAAPARPGPKMPAQHVVKRTRFGGIWVASALFALVLLLLLIFILENGAKVKISFFGASGHLPLGVALLFAAVLGILLVVLPGTARIIQLRRTARRHRKLDGRNARAAAAAQAPAPGPGAPS